MIINGATLKALSKSLSKIFDNALGKVETSYKKISTVVENVGSMTVSYAWLGDVPKMREWVGDRVLKDLKAFGYSITKKDWEATIEVTRDEIEYDQLGLVKPRIEQMGHASETHYDEMLYALIEANGTCYDGKPFFDATHDIGGVAFSNIGNKVLNKASALAARTEMRALKSDNGKSLKIKPTLLVVPAELEIVAKQICENEKINNVENEAKGLFEYMVADDLTDATSWYLLDVNKPIKPFIMQKNKPIKFTAMDSDNDENAFMRKSYRYGVDSQDNAGYGLWQCAYKSTGTVA